MESLGLISRSSVVPTAAIFAAAFGLISVLHYVATRFRFQAPEHKIGIGEKGLKPSLVPYAIPLLGALPFSFFWDPLAFSHTYFAFWQRRPVRLRAFFQDVYVIQGAQNMVSLFKYRSTVTTVIHRMFLSNIFLLPRQVEEIYRNDNSGDHVQPNPGTHVEHRNRLEYHGRVANHRLLLGPGQAPLFRKLYTNSVNRLSALEIGQEWVHIPDLLDIFKFDLTAAALDSLTGPALLQRSPSFIKDMWEIDDNMIGLLSGLPRFLNAKAQRARDRAHDAVLDWQAWARQNFTPESVDEEGNDPFWGCEFFRTRQETFSKMDGFDYRAMASEELLFIWSANTNAIVASFWLTLHAFRDPELLQAVREEVRPCLQLGPDNQLGFDVPKLLSQPLLQAMFAENLRLCVHGFLIRRPEREDWQVNGWTIPRSSWCISSSTPSSMDPDFWCQGENATHPVDQFWPGRFLKRDPQTNALTFSLLGTEGSWVPFGGGAHTCPGRLFTKRQNILALAIMVTLYDGEVLAEEKDMALKSRTCPLGTISPNGKVPIRMRRRDYI